MKYLILLVSSAVGALAAQSTVYVTAEVAPTPSSPASSAAAATSAAGPTIEGSTVAVSSSVASSAVSSAAASGTGSATSGGVCGQGYTYCGYILRDHQGFATADIEKAYCAAHADNCKGGKPKSDPIQALYVCLPGNVSPSPQQEAKDRLAQAVRRRQVVAASSAVAAGPSASAGVAGSAGTAGSCSAPTTGNKLQLLCSCTGKCLNPKEDHIGRCDQPC